MDHLLFCVRCVPVVAVYVILITYFKNDSNSRTSSSQLHSRRKQAFHAILQFAQYKWFKQTFKVCRPYLREVLTLFEVTQLNHLLDSLFPEFVPHKKPRYILGYPASWMILSAIMLHPQVCARHGWSLSRNVLPILPNSEIVTWRISLPTKRPNLQPTPPEIRFDHGFDIKLASEKPYQYLFSESTKVNNVCVEPRILSTNNESEYHPQQTIVLDTGSSFSLTPYAEDLIYILKEGDLGTVSTVDNTKIQLTKLGYAEYFIRDTNSNDKPFYPIVFVIPGTNQRLLSPQDYAKCLPWRDDDYIAEIQPHFCRYEYLIPTHQHINSKPTQKSIQRTMTERKIRAGDW
jgi:hypothetical protein